MRESLAAAPFGRAIPAGTEGENSIPLHNARLNFVLGSLIDSGARTVLDLGCGSGALLKRAAAHEQFQHIMGIEASEQALAVARRELASHTRPANGKVSLLQGSCLDESQWAEGFEAAVLVETIEHLDPRRLSMLERSLFANYRPGTVIITTPNKEYNVLYGLEDHERRDPDHRFEWTRLKFRTWSNRIARQYGYRVMFGNIGEAHPALGSPSQAARFTCEADARAATASD